MLSHKLSNKKRHLQLLLSPYGIFHLKTSCSRNIRSLFSLTHSVPFFLRSPCFSFHVSTLLPQPDIQILLQPDTRIPLITIAPTKLLWPNPARVQAQLKLHRLGPQKAKKLRFEDILSSCCMLKRLEKPSVA